jgi:hypothetical protein
MSVYDILLVVCDERKKAEIEQLLKEFKDCWDDRVLDRTTSSDNEDTMTALQITTKHRAEEIRKLKYSDYYRGPSPDDIYPEHDIWEFGRRVKGNKTSAEVYIKIKVYLDANGRKKGKCFSFHFPKWQITYPFKKKGAKNV